MMSLRQQNSHLLIGTVALAAAVLVLLLVDNAIVRTLAALPLLFVLPGYAISMALFRPGSLRRDLQALLCVGLSLATVIAGALLMHLTIGLRREGWLAWLAFVTLIAGAFGAWRWRETSYLMLGNTAPAMPLRRKFGLWACAVVAAGIMLAAVVIGSTPASPTLFSGYTALWIVPTPQTQAATVALGVQNSEFTPMSYQLRLQRGETLIGEWNNIKLQPGQRWQTNLPLPLDGPTDQPVRALLYRADQPGEVYREGIWWPSKP